MNNKEVKPLRLHVWDGGDNPSVSNHATLRVTMTEPVKDVKHVVDEKEFQNKLLQMPWESIRQQVDAFDKSVDRRFDEVDRRFISLDKKIDDVREDVHRLEERMDKRFDLLQSQLAQHEAQTDKRFDLVLNQIGQVEAKSNQRFELMQAQLDRIESKIEKKTDRTLNNWYFLIMPIVAVIIGAIIGKLNF